MGGFLIVSKADKIEEYKKISGEYKVSFEINDFFVPQLLDNEENLHKVMQLYKKIGIPKNSTMHGAFLDLAIFSTDKKIRKISQFRMKQSLEIAKELGLKGVVFHVNYNPQIPGESYKQYVIDTTVVYLKKLLEQYKNIEIYLENMFETDPYVLKKISEQLQGYRNYGVCLDWAHMHVYGKNMKEWIARLHPYVKHIHINDNDKRDDLHLPLGNGKLNWEDFFACYIRYFQNCSVLIEMNQPNDQRQSLDYIRENFGCL